MKNLLFLSALLVVLFGCPAFADENLWDTSPPTQTVSTDWSTEPCGVCLHGGVCTCGPNCVCKSAEVQKPAAPKVQAVKYSSTPVYYYSQPVYYYGGYTPSKSYYSLPYYGGYGGSYGSAVCSSGG